MVAVGEGQQERKSKFLNTFIDFHRENVRWTCVDMGEQGGKQPVKLPWGYTKNLLCGSRSQREMLNDNRRRSLAF